MECTLLNNMATPTWIQSSENVRQVRTQEQIAYFETGLDVNNPKIQQTKPESNVELSQVLLSPLEPNLSVNLQDVKIWNKFSAAQTEMIVTKPGRRIFPGYRVKLSGLDPNDHYCVLMDVISMDDNRYKFQNGQWVVSGRGEPRLPPKFYLHPKSPSTGSKWMKDLVSFHKVKLTNSFSQTASDKFNVHSMHRYQMRVHIVRTSDVSRIQYEPMSTFAFAKTTFITVTAYQNHEVTQLKIENNPFARGFRSDGGKTKNARCISAIDDYTSNANVTQQPTKRCRSEVPGTNFLQPACPSIQQLNGYTSFQPQLSPDAFSCTSSSSPTNDFGHASTAFFPHSSPTMTYQADTTSGYHLPPHNSFAPQPNFYEESMMCVPSHPQQFSFCDGATYQPSTNEAYADSAYFAPHPESALISPHVSPVQQNDLNLSPTSSSDEGIFSNYSGSLFTCDKVQLFC